MAGKRDHEITVIVPGLTKQEAKDLRDALLQERNKVAPKAKGMVVAGKKENFYSLMHRCKKALKGD